MSPVTTALAGDAFLCHLAEGWASGFTEEYGGTWRISAFLSRFDESVQVNIYAFDQETTVRLPDWWFDDQPAKVADAVSDAATSLVPAQRLAELAQGKAMLALVEELCPK